MIEYHSDCIDTAVSQAYSTLPESRGRPLKAHILGSLQKGIRRDATTAALMSAALAEPVLLAPGRKHYRKTLEDLKKQGVPKNLVLVVLCAVDGLMLTEFLQVEPFTASERKGLVDALMALAETGNVPLDDAQGQRMSHATATTARNKPKE